MARLRGNMHDALPARIEGNRSWFGQIATEPTSHSDRLYVIVPDFHPDLRWGPCRWQSRDDVTIPARGDHCLLVFDNRREPWVVAWWPFNT